jgi:hypothetical protein
VGSISTTTYSTSKLVLLLELVDYKDVANNNTANALLEHYRSDYAIKIKEGTTVLYRPLYNLSLKELKVLSEYLVEAKRLG